MSEGVRRRLTAEERELRDQERLARIRGGASLANDARVVEEFAARGIPAAEVLPRVNVLTFRAWLSLGRVVRKGEHGVVLPVVVETGGQAGAAEEGAAQAGAEGADGKGKGGRLLRSMAVFHISQTEVRRG